ncbi:hypothetical protein J0B02_11985 [Enterobacteriaceae bacterium YMB-R22]|jgi:hypothetical protein|nr:hypothetical protein [Tenebrionicola larvae]
MEMKSPISFRFSDNLMDKLKARATTKKTTIADLVRETLESSIDNEDIETKHYHDLITSPVESLVKIHRKLHSNLKSDSYTLNLPEIKFIIHYCYLAYQNNSGIISNEYLIILVLFTTRLIGLSLETNTEFDKHYVYRCLDVNEGSLDNDLVTLHHELEKKCNSFSSEYILRPLYSDAFNLENYNQDDLKPIFSKERLKILLPLVVKGIIYHIGKGNYIIKEMATIQSSHRECFSVANLDFSIECIGNDHYSDELPYLYFIISGANFTQPIDCKKFIALLRIIKAKETDSLDMYKNESDGVKIYFASRHNDKVHIELGSFRLIFSQSEYQAFVKKLEKSLNTPQLQEQVEAFKLMYGDI